MARSIWTGTISFGLVTVPVKLYSAVNRKTVRFHQLHGETGMRIQQKRVDPSTGDEVPYDAIVKGFEIGPDRYVIVQPEELEALDPRKTKTIEIEDFVDLSEIDPIFYDHPYYLAPGPGGAKPYRLLLEAMRESGKVAIAKVVIRQKEQLVAIRPMRRRPRDGDDDLRRRGRRRRSHSTSSTPPARSRSTRASWASPSSSSSRWPATSSPASTTTPIARRSSRSSSARPPARRSRCSPRPRRPTSRCPT